MNQNFVNIQPIKSRMKKKFNETKKNDIYSEIYKKLFFEKTKLITIKLIKCTKK